MHNAVSLFSSSRRRSGFVFGPKEPRLGSTQPPTNTSQTKTMWSGLFPAHATAIRPPLFLRSCAVCSAERRQLSSSTHTATIRSHVRRAHSTQTFKHNSSRTTSNHTMNIQAYYLLLAVALSLSRCGPQQLRIGTLALGQLPPQDRGDVASQILVEDFANQFLKRPASSASWLAPKFSSTYRHRKPPAESFKPRRTLPTKFSDNWRWRDAALPDGHWPITAPVTRPSCSTLRRCAGAATSMIDGDGGQQPQVGSRTPAT